VRLLDGRRSRCELYGSLIKGVSSRPQSNTESIQIDTTHLNSSQARAVLDAVRSDLTLVHGPPGTGKTSTVVRIINEWRKHSPEESILVTASTNNAVDNVLEKFVSGGVVRDLVRVCPDASALSKSAAKYWVGAFVEGDINKPSAAMKEAQRRVMDAKIIFTTCTGAGLGLLRKLTFPYVIVNEASQITEPNSLIPLVKGCKKAVLVGDHVQLRPTVTQLGEAYGYDISLFERLYRSPETGGVAKVMLDKQYRMHPDISKFPSSRFYDGKLSSGVTSAERVLGVSEFDWEGRHIVFQQSEGLESFFHGSKKNEDQANLCKHVVPLFRKHRSVDSSQRQGGSTPEKMSIAILTPYTAQLKLLKSLEKNPESETVSSITVATVDSFQGREADVVVLCTVRHNAYRNIGFLADERRINVALTRTKRGLIVIGHKDTLINSEEGKGFWRSWFGSIPK
jgi:superfamily I DNA and/or RNA helicase